MTIKELLKELSKERYDKKNLPFYIRKYGVGCWKVEGFSNEDSGFYLNAGEETNPQSTVEQALGDADIDTFTEDATIMEDK